MSRKTETPDKPKNRTEKSNEKTSEKSKSSSGQMRDKLRFRDYWHEKGKLNGDILKL